MDADSMEFDSDALRLEPTRGRAAETTRRILDAAAALIEDHGLERLTTTDVAARAGVSVGSLYRYFADREAIIRTLWDRNERLFHDTLMAAAAVPRGGLAADIGTLLDTALHLHRTIPAYNEVRAAQWHMPGGRSARTASVERLERELEDVLATRHHVTVRPGWRRLALEAVQRADALAMAAFLDHPDMDDGAFRRLSGIVRSTVGTALASIVKL